MSMIDGEYDNNYDNVRLQQAGPIAIRYGLRIADVAALLSTLAYPREYLGVDLGEGDLDAGELTEILSAHRSGLEALLKAVSMKRLDMGTLTSAFHIDRMWVLKMAHDVLSNFWVFRTLVAAREKPADPRRSILHCLMATAGQWWFDHTESWPAGTFVETDEGLEPSPDTAMDFIVDCLESAGYDYTNEEIADSSEEMRDAIGMTGYLRDAANDPTMFEDWMTDFGIQQRPAGWPLTLVEPPS